MTKRSATQFINDTIYSLKREYGFSLTIFKKLASIINIESGAVTNTLSFKYVQRAVLLPTTMIRELFKVEYDSNSRLIVIDFDDLGDFTIEIDDYIVFNNRKYLVNGVTTWDYDAAVMLNVKESLGSAVNEYFEATSAITLTQVASGVVV